MVDTSALNGTTATGKNVDWTRFHYGVQTVSPTSATSSVNARAGLGASIPNFSTSSFLGSNPRPKVTPQPNPQDATVEVPTAKKEGTNWWSDPLGNMEKWAVSSALGWAVNWNKADPLSKAAMVTGAVTNPAASILGKGNQLEGTMQVLALPEKAVTSILLTEGQLAQSAGNVLSARSWNDVGPLLQLEAQHGLDNLGKAWSWDNQEQSQVQELDANGDPKFDDKGNPIMTDAHDNVDIGTAFMYAVGQTVRMPQSLSPWSTKRTAEEQKKYYESDSAAIDTFSGFVKDWGFTFAEGNFDIYSTSQRDTIAGLKRDENTGALIGNDSGTGIGGNPHNLGNWLVQGMNFVGDLATDPLTYVPFGKVGRVLFMGRRALVNVGEKTLAKRVTADADNLIKVAEGKTKEGYWDFAEFAAKSDANTISQHIALRSMNSSERDAIVYLLGEANTPQQVAKVLLATEYGSQKAFKDLLIERPNLDMALDTLDAGGYLARATRKGALENTGVVDPLTHAEFYKALLPHMTRIANDDFARVLRDTAFKINEGGISMGLGTTREFMFSTNGVMNAIEEAMARTRNWALTAPIIDQIDDEVIHITHQMGQGTQFLVTRVLRPMENLSQKAARKAFSVRAQGVIDVENIDGLAGQKFLGMLNKIESKIAKRPPSKLAQETLNKTKNEWQDAKQSLLQEWRSATTPMARAAVVNKANDLGLSVLARHAGLSETSIAEVRKGMIERKAIGEDQLRKTGILLAQDNGQPLLIHDPILFAQTPNTVMTWNWDALQNGLFTYGKALNAGALVLNGKETYRLVNGLYMSALTARPARWGREIVANSLGILPSGYAGKIWGQNLTRFGSKIGGVFSKPSKELQDTLDIEGTATWARTQEKILRKSSSLELIGQTLSVLSEEKQILEQAIVDEHNAILNSILEGNAKNFTEEEILDTMAYAENLAARVHYHGTKTDVSGKWQFDNNRGIALFDAQAGAKAHAHLGGTEVFVKDATESLSTPDTVGKKLTNNRVDLNTALSTNNIVHVRVPGRGRKWELLDTAKLAKQTDADIAKYEYRMLTPKQAKLTNTSVADLSTALDNGQIVRYVDPITKETRTLSRTKLDSWGTELPAGLNARVYGKGEVPSVMPVTVYGDEVVLKDIAKLDPELKKALGVTTQAQLDKWIANKGYDKLSQSVLAHMEDNNIGSFRLVDPVTKKEVVVANPWFVDSAGSSIKLQAVILKRLAQKYNLLLDPKNEADNVSKDLLELDPIPGTESFADWAKSSIFLKRRRTPTGKGQDFEANAQVLLPTEGRRKAIKDVPLQYFLTKKQLEDITSRSQAVISKLTDRDKRILKLSAAMQAPDRTRLQILQSAKYRLADIETQRDVLYNSLRQQYASASKIEKIKLQKFIEGKPEFSDAKITVNGNEFDQALSGESGRMYRNRINRDTVDTRLSASGTWTSDSAVKHVEVNKNDPRYWEAWANVLNRHFRTPKGNLDPVIRRVIEGKHNNLTDEQIQNELVMWMKTTTEGSRYAESIGVGDRFESGLHTDVAKVGERSEQMIPEEWAKLSILNVNKYIGKIIANRLPGYQNPIAEKLLLLDNAIIGMNNKALSVEQRAAFKKALETAGSRIEEKDLSSYWLSGERDTLTIGKMVQEGTVQPLNKAELTFDNLPTISGLLTDPAQRRNAIETIRHQFDTINKVFSDQPAEFMFKNPLFKASYEANLLRLAKTVEVAKGTNAITDAERNEITKQARNAALADVRKWTYSVTNTTNIVASMNQIIPFLNATTWQLKWMGMVARNHPATMAWMGYQFNKAVHTTQWYDKNGNPVTWEERDAQGNRKASYIKLPVIDAVANVLGNIPLFGGLKDTKQLMVSRTSLDPVFNGNTFDAFGISVPNPFINWSFGPGIAIPVSELRKNLTGKDGVLGGLGDAINWLYNTVPNLKQALPSIEAGSLDLLQPGKGLQNLAAVGDELFGGVIQAFGGEENFFKKFLPEYQRDVLNTAVYVNGLIATNQLRLNANGNIDDGTKDGMPIDKYITHGAGVIYDLRNASSFWMPFSTKYWTEADIARGHYNSIRELEYAEYNQNPDAYRKKYLNWFGDGTNVSVANVNPGAIAQSKFLTKYPDEFYAAINITQKDFSVPSTPGVIKHFNQYGNTVDSLSRLSNGGKNQTALDVAADILGYQSQSTGSFSPEAYAIIAQNYQGLVPQDVLANKVLAAKGWELYNNGVDVYKVDKNGEILRDKTGNPIPETDYSGNPIHIMGMRELEAYSRKVGTPIDLIPWVQDEKDRLKLYIRTGGTYQGRDGKVVKNETPNSKAVGQAWWNAKSEFDTNHYNNAADAWNLVVSDSTWKSNMDKGGDAPLASAIQNYLSHRAGWADELNKRGGVTMSSVPSLQYEYDNYVYTQKQTVPGFADWYNKYFEGDTLK